MKDKRPVCVGKASPDGLHVLRGGGFLLPGNSGVQYDAAETDGTTRTALPDWSVPHVSHINTAAGTAGIGANCAAMPVAVRKSPGPATRWSLRG
ncbi:hypothetical protein [Streptomyces sp. NPDC087437]|uniref:hypothetical protein n=1 Tax=Streptomyces sp. NPDC087437 TaxID=3365789 RepID=UPI0038217A14